MVDNVPLLTTCSKSKQQHDFKIQMDENAASNIVGDVLKRPLKLLNTTNVSSVTTQNLITTATTTITTTTAATTTVSVMPTTTPLMLRISIPVPFKMQSTKETSKESNAITAETLLPSTMRMSSLSVTSTSSTMTTASSKVLQCLPTNPSLNTPLIMKDATSTVTACTTFSPSLLQSLSSTSALASSLSSASGSTSAVIDEETKFKGTKSLVKTANTKPIANGSISNGNGDDLVPQLISDRKQKKTVTFKNVLETSDDKSAIKRFYNPDNRKPLVSIIKKDSRNVDCIVRPSRLTNILKRYDNDSSGSKSASIVPTASSRTSTIVPSRTPSHSNISSENTFNSKLLLRKHSCITDRLQEHQIYKRNFSSLRQRNQFLYKKNKKINRREGSENYDKFNINANNEEECRDISRNYELLEADNCSGNDDDEEMTQNEGILDDEENVNSLVSSSILNDPSSHLFGNSLNLSEQQTMQGSDNQSKTHYENDDIHRNGYIENISSKLHERQMDANNFAKFRKVTKYNNRMDGNPIGATPVNKNIISEEDNDDDNRLQLIVDKFILPKRSTRSSRLIKPNKRLLEDGFIVQKSTSKNSNSCTTAITNNNQEKTTGKQRSLICVIFL